MMKWLSTLPIHKFDVIVDGEPRVSPLGQAENCLILKHKLEQESQTEGESQCVQQDVKKDSEEVEEATECQSSNR